MGVRWQGFTVKHDAHSPTASRVDPSAWHQLVAPKSHRSGCSSAQDPSVAPRLPENGDPALKAFPNPALPAVSCHCLPLSHPLSSRLQAQQAAPCGQAFAHEAHSPGAPNAPFSLGAEALPGPQATTCVGGAASAPPALAGAEAQQGAAGKMKQCTEREKPGKVPKPRLAGKHSTRTPQCGRTKNCTLRAPWGGPSGTLHISPRPRDFPCSQWPGTKSTH